MTSSNPQDPYFNAKHIKPSDPAAKVQPQKPVTTSTPGRENYGD